MDRISVTIISTFGDDLPNNCNETLHLSFRIILYLSTSNFKLRPHIFIGSVFCPMYKRDLHAPALFLLLLCFLFPIIFRSKSSACTRLCVRRMYQRNPPRLRHDVRRESCRTLWGLADPCQSRPIGARIGLALVPILRSAERVHPSASRPAGLVSQPCSLRARAASERYLRYQIRGLWELCEP